MAMPLNYQRFPGLKPYTRMRTCREYHILPPLYKSMWDEYRALRSKRIKLDEILASLEEPKPRFKLEGGKPRRVVHITQNDMVKKEWHKTTSRLNELALYFYAGIRWVAPDYTQEQLDEIFHNKE